LPTDKTQTSAKIRFKSTRNSEFKKLFKKLSPQLQSIAKSKYENYFSKNPYHSFLRGHEVEDKYRSTTSWSVWIDYSNRALAERYVENGIQVFNWYWIGSHEDYNNRLGK
tara:strand:- start:4085 stop:4414 length:330 start_codon:yes stop_codon:yes gene_type:complete